MEGSFASRCGADLCNMQPDDTLSLQGFSLQQEHLRHAADGHPDAIDIQSLLRWYYAELNAARVTDAHHPSE